MDYSEYIPVLCQTEGSFHGKSYWEKISSVVGHNGKSVDGPMTKSDFAEYDEVVIQFGCQDYRGVVKYNGNVIATRSQSPRPVSSVQPDRPAAVGTSDTTTATDLPTTSCDVTKTIDSIYAKTKQTTPKKRRFATKRKGSILPDVKVPTPGNPELSLMRGHAGITPTNPHYSGGGFEEKIRGIEMSNLETRLMLDNLRSELTNFKMEVRLEMRMNQAKQTGSGDVAEILSSISADIRNDLASLKKRQDQLFYKQDQIQSTLAGETPPVSNSSGFRSPSGSSVLAWSSLPVQMPGPSPRHQQQNLMAGHVQPPQSAAAPPVDSSDYLYSINDISSLLDEDPYQSSLSDAGGVKSDLGSLLAESLGNPAPAQFQPSEQPSALPILGSSQEAHYSTPLRHPQPVTHQPMTLSPVLPRHNRQSTMSMAPHAGNPAMPPPRKRTRLELSPEDSGHSTSLKDAQLVVKKYANFANVADMGKLACMLARQSFFGDDVLRVSTVHGKSAQFQALDRQKLSALLATIHELPEFREKSKQEFSLLYMPKINSSLSRLCMNLRKI